MSELTMLRLDVRTSARLDELINRIRNGSRAVVHRDQLIEAILKGILGSAIPDGTTSVDSLTDEISNADLSWLFRENRPEQPDNGEDEEQFSASVQLKVTKRAKLVVVPKPLRVDRKRLDRETVLGALSEETFITKTDLVSATSLPDNRVGFVLTGLRREGRVEAGVRGTWRRVPLEKVEEVRAKLGTPVPRRMGRRQEILANLDGPKSLDELSSILGSPKAVIANSLSRLKRAGLLTNDGGLWSKSLA